jgi:acetyltransferase-like isoleucine patch superfamily enzyme
MKPLFKNLAVWISLVLVFPLAAIALFGRLRPGFTFGAHWVALVPGIPGDYLRVAFYRCTLRSCSLRSRISFGTFFSNPDAVVEEGVYIGSYCVIGRARIGANTQIASLVQVLSGARQHARDEQGSITGSNQGQFVPVTIGANSWIGASAIVMADVGNKSTIGAGSVVTKPVPPSVIAAGNPARVLRAIESV